ncbi:pilus (MSHA type) biogenesis protein MshL [Helicobacter anatolicus]|uniref:pilus (MSHA type) biogenesis protein MshL n=1 Tax=Helicobacter anatolicus TaxID=2905874 RepID=UPI001E379647|nr:pilus (MSHA type) biogenesis protein MshL [Helicobacter anatolicus]MCE3040376.1 pilus (MSHA type) biogenesis protein MshL [Helicobacter anatolicus]
MRIFLLFYLFCTLNFAHICSEKTFDISLSNQNSFKDILEMLAQECMLSIIFQDKYARSILEEKNIILNFYHSKLDEILQTGFEALDLYYIFKDNTIKISSLQTKTFYIHYIATSRIASSNTNIIFSQDKDSNFYNNHFLQQNSNPNIDTQQNLFNLANQQEESSNRSGSKIYSIDAFDFWGELEQELWHIVFRENDKHIPLKDHHPITINKGSGFITITASPSQIKRAKEYLQALNKKISLQVLIDVNILNISHKDIQTTGIDWSTFYSLGINKENNPLTTIQGSNLQYGINIFPQDLSIGKIIEFLYQYGNVKTISNPKILTLNNQPAIISVGNIIRYTQNYIYQTSNSSTTLQNTRQQYPSIFSGILLDITPSIEDDYIILKINPSITATKDIKIENEADALPSPPNLSTNQISSIVRLKNNQKVILGGLISKVHSKEKKKIPLLGYIPLIKYLFSYSKEAKQVQEMVIVITPKIIQFKEQDENTSL